MLDYPNVIEERCNKLLNNAVLFDATDIHLVPTEEEYEVLFNRNNQLHLFQKIPSQLATRMISYFKFLSSLDISNRRKPQSGSFHKEIEEKAISFRVSTIPAIHYAESVVIRLQKHDRIVSLDQLCVLVPNWAESLRRAMKLKQGLILISGPTGSGKTTTMYSLTSYAVQQLQRHIISIEDPVENKQHHLLQIQVNEHAGLSYSTGLKAILRHSPDIILLGEIRDAETAKIAIQASLTGHLIISTIHAKDTIGCFYRMLDFGITADELNQTLVCLASQRLVQTGEHSAAVFEIIDGDELHVMKNLLMNEKVIPQPPHSIEEVVKQFEQE